MSSFSFVGHASGQNATTIVIDDVNDLNTAKSLAQARYPGYRISEGTKMSGGGSSSVSSTVISTPRVNEGYQSAFAGVKFNHDDVSYRHQTNSGYAALGLAFIGGTFWLGKELIRMTWNFSTDVLRVLLRWSLIITRNVVYASAVTLNATSHVTQKVCVWSEDKLNTNWHF